MPIFSICNIYSLVTVISSHLAIVYVLLYFLPTGGNCLLYRVKLGLFVLYNYCVYYIFNFFCLFALYLAIVGGCGLWRLSVCKAR